MNRVNISEPWGDEPWRSIERQEIDAVRISVRDRRIMELEAQLDSIFNRAAAGDLFELHYHDGKVIVVKPPAPK